MLEHERIPFISYPYEWTFDMLRDAAVLHLELLLAALEEGLTMKDGYSFNVQWRGATPTFIDVGSFERGTRRAVGRVPPVLPDVPLPADARGAPRHLVPALSCSATSTGIDPTEMRAFFPGGDKFKKGVFKHVYLHSVAETRVTKDSEKVQRAISARPASATSSRRRPCSKLLKLVRKLRSKRADSGWKAYRETCSYSDADREAEGSVPARRDRRRRTSSSPGTSAATTASTRASSPSRAAP